MKTNNLSIFVLMCAALMLSCTSQKLQLRVCTFNIRMDTPRDSLNSWAHRKDFVNALIQFHDFDIVGTQEGFIHQLEDIARMPGWAFVGVGRDDGDRGGEFSAIFYKTTLFDLLDNGDFWLSETPDVPGKGWDATCCHRICSWAKFRDKKTKTEFFVFNVHFDHQGVVARRESSKLMIEKIKEIAGDAPVIALGDFNATPESEPMQIMLNYLSDAFEISATPPYGPVGTFNGFRLNAPMRNRIDYVLLSKHFSVLKYGALTDFLEQRFPSDHLPVMADLVVSR